jgi:hypothetical protein
MLFTSDRKASRAKRAFMVCMFVITFGTVTLTMIVDNAPSQPTEVAREGPLRRIVCLVLAAGLLCAGLYILFIGMAAMQMLLMGALLIAAGAGWLWEDFLAPRARRPTSPTI